MEATSTDYELVTPCTKILESLNSTGLVGIYITVFILSFLGNIVVIFVVLFMENRRTSTDLYLMHLAIADLLFSFTLPFWAAYIHYGYWPFGTIMCKLISGMQQATFYCSVFMLACISIDRYMAIVKATQFMNRKLHVVGVVCALMWLFAILLSLPVMVHREAFTSDGLPYLCHDKMSAESSDDWRMGIRIVRHVLGFFLPLVIMIFCYSFTVITLCHSRNSQKQKAMRVILCVVLAFIVCWLPNNIIELTDNLMRVGRLGETCDLMDSIDIGLYVTEAMAFSHCAINPILYAFIGKKFRNQLLVSLFKKGFLRRDLLLRYRKGSVHSSGSTRQMSVTL